MRIRVFLIILGMAIVTYIPRAIPAAVIEKMKFGKKAEKFLKLIPYTAMAALIFPAVVETDTAHPIVGIAGGITAGVGAYLKLPVMVCVLLAIAVDLGLYMFVI